jgi:hypothetical protein
MGMLRAGAAFSERFRNDEEKGLGGGYGRSKPRGRLPLYTSEVRQVLLTHEPVSGLTVERSAHDYSHASKGYSQPPLKPARRNPVRTGKQRRMMSQSKPVR